MTNAPTPQPSQDGSLKRTLLKTVATVVLTVLFISLVREGLSALPWLDHVTGSQSGTSVLRFLAADGVTQKQQIVAVGLMLACFALALVVVKGGERFLRRS